MSPEAKYLKFRIQNHMTYFFNLLNEGFVLCALEVPYERNPLICFFLIYDCVRLAHRKKNHKKECRGKRFGITQSWIWMLAPTQAKLHHLSESQFPHLYGGYETYFLRLLWRRNDLMYLNCLAQLLLHGSHVSCPWELLSNMKRWSSPLWVSTYCSYRYPSELLDDF